VIAWARLTTLVGAWLRSPASVRSLVGVWRSLVAILLAGCGFPRLPETWTEASLCGASSARDLVIVDGTGRPIAGAMVWTQARLREGSRLGADTVATDVIKSGTVAISETNGHVRLCDVTVPLVDAYGTTGWTAGGIVWRSVLAVDLFVQHEHGYVRVSRFASAAFGTGTLHALPAAVVFASPIPLAPTESPVVGRPSDRWLSNPE
jgi:hypothetical protein